MTTFIEKILSGEIPAERVYEDEWCVAVRDLNPVAPVHILVFPKHKVMSLGEADLDDVQQRMAISAVHLSAATMAQQMGLDSFRVVCNTKTADERVPYLHAHVLSGRKFEWPPG